MGGFFYLFLQLLIDKNENHKVHKPIKDFRNQSCAQKNFITSIVEDINIAFFFLDFSKNPREDQVYLY